MFPLSGMRRLLCCLWYQGAAPGWESGRVLDEMEQPPLFLLRAHPSSLTLTQLQEGAVCRCRVAPGSSTPQELELVAAAGSCWWLGLGSGSGLGLGLGRDDEALLCRVGRGGSWKSSAWRDAEACGFLCFALLALSSTFNLWFSSGF